MQSSISHMAQMLAPRPETASLSQSGYGEKVGRMRKALAERGPMMAAELAEAACLPNSSAVGALFKADLAAGRVLFTNRLYSLCPQFDARLQADIAAATTLLRKHGYEILPPGRQETPTRH